MSLRRTGLRRKGPRRTGPGRRGSRRLRDLDDGRRLERRADIPGDAERVAVVAQWSPTARLSRSASQLIAELQQAGYWVVVSSTCPASDELGVHPAAAVDLARLNVLRRANIGYDFASWAVALDLLDERAAADKVLLVNDSLVGPFAPLGPVLAGFESTTADVWGMVESRQVTPHLQSFFRGFRHGVLREPALRRFWADLPVVEDKARLIADFEYGFARFLAEAGFSSAAHVHGPDVVPDELNPTIAGWERLLEAGVPFVKRELLRCPDLAPDGWRVPEVLAARYGVIVDEWW